MGQLENHMKLTIDQEERAAIMEYDGGLTREEAERAAIEQAGS